MTCRQKKIKVRVIVGPARSSLFFGAENCFSSATRINPSATDVRTGSET
jgi:hypothetical protein